MYKILVADDNKIFLEGLVSLLNRNNECEVIGTASNGKELVEHDNIDIANIVLVDLEMPVMSGMEAVKQLNSNYPHVKAIAVSMYQEKAYLEELIKTGFMGFVNKSRIIEDLFKVIRDVTNGEYNFDQNIKLEK